MFSVGRDKTLALDADGGVGKENVSAADGGGRPDEGTTSLVCDRLPAVITPPLVGEWSIVMSMSSLCLSVCLSASISLEIHAQPSPKFLCLLLMAETHYTSGSIVIRYILLVLWMMNIYTFWAIWRHVKTVVASDVTVSSCTGYCPCCVILVASCPRRQQAPRLDESIMRGVLTDRGWSLLCTIAFLCLNPPLCLFALACFLLVIIRAAGNHNHCEYCDFGCVS